MFLGDTKNFPECSSEIMTSGFVLPIPDHPPLMFTSHPSIILFSSSLFLPLRVPPMMSSLGLTGQLATFAVPPVFRFPSPSSYVQRSWEEVKQKQIRSHTEFALPTMIIHMDYSSLPHWGRETESERRRRSGVGEGQMYWNREIK